MLKVTSRIIITSATIASALGSSLAQAETVIDPLTSSSSYKEAYAMLEARDFGGAIRKFDELIKESDKSPGIYYGRAKAKQELGDNKGALVDYTKSIEL